MNGRVPFAAWKTLTFVAALRFEGMDCANVDPGGDERRLGCNLNLPLASGTGNPGYVEAGLAGIGRFGASVLIISLGFDAHLGDPTANLAVTGEGFRTIGQRIGSLGVPTLLVQEGGYIVERLGDNLSAFLDRFLPTR